MVQAVCCCCFVVVVLLLLLCCAIVVLRCSCADVGALLVVNKSFLLITYSLGQLCIIFQIWQLSNENQQLLAIRLANQMIQSPYLVKITPTADDQENKTHYLFVTSI